MLVKSQGIDGRARWPFAGFGRKQANLVARNSKTENEVTGYALLRDMLGGMPLEEGYDSFVQLFAKFDKDLSGKISLAEFKSTLQDMGVSLSEAQVLILLCFRIEND
jgi:Ca2+-binding EF-hand superfamily protein